jgi:adenosine deaminase
MEETNSKSQKNLEMDLQELEQKILKMPKTDLHVHLDGSLRIDTVIDLAKKQGVKLPSEDRQEIQKILQAGENCQSLEDYLKPFDITLSIMQTGDALMRCAYELAEDAAKENVKYIEIRYSPILHTQKGLKLTEIVDAVVEGLKKAEHDFDIKAGIIICGIRSISPDISLRLAELSAAYKNRGIVGFDLAGVEENYPAKEHLQAFFLILKNNINCTIHAGEAYGPESIHQAVHYCGAHRIGHGTRLKEDGDLLNYINDHRIPLEICLSSNVHTKAAPNFESHPLKFYYDYGLRVTLNTDNRLVSNTNITKEYLLAVKHFGFTLNDLKQIAINGFKSAFIPMRTRVNLLPQISKELAMIN